MVEFDIWLAMDGRHEVIESGSETMDQVKTIIAKNDSSDWMFRYIKRCIPFYNDLAAYEYKAA